MPIPIRALRDLAFSEYLLGQGIVRGGGGDIIIK